MKLKFLVSAFGLLFTSNIDASILEWTQEEVRVYEENKEALTFRCEIAAQDAFQIMRETYHLPSTDEDFVYKLMLERESRKATCDYIFNVPKDRVKKKKIIDELYQDSIDVRLLPHNDILAGANVCLALRLADKLGINAEKYNKIMKLGLSVAKHLRKNPRYNYDVEVMDNLRNFLTKEQLVTILRSRNAVQAVNKAVATWNEVKAAGLIENEDSASCTQNAIGYFLEEYIINDMYVGHDKVLKKNLSDLRKGQPIIVRLNSSIKKKEELIRKKEEENEFNEMAW